MFDREDAISEWRHQMAGGGVRSSTVLDELESHLRDHIASLVSSGIPEAQAFELATSHLGGAGRLAAEFQKLKATSRPLRVGLLLWIGFATALAGRLAIGVFPGKPDLELSAHIFCLTAGYSAAVLTGGFGFYYVCLQRRRALSLAGEHALSRAVLLFTRLSAGLVVAALLLGLVWTKQNRGVYLAGGVSELGTVCATAWMIAFWLLQTFGRTSKRLTMLLCILGNMIISLAWFGTGILAHGYGLGSSALLNTWMAVHLVFLAVGVMPKFEMAGA